MDDLRDAISKTNELLAELIRRDDERMKVSEAKREELKSKLAEDPKKKLDEIMAKVREESPVKDLETRRQKLEADAAETRRKHQEFNDEVVRMLTEQTELLKKIAERLAK